MSTDAVSPLRQRMIEDMNARKLCAGTQRGHISSCKTEFKGVRSTKSKPVPGPHQVYGFLTTSPNALIEPIHPNAMPVILTTESSVSLLPVIRHEIADGAWR